MRSTITILVITLLPFAGCNSGTSGGELSPEEFAGGIEERKNAQVLDVRTEREVANGVLADAVIIDYFSENFDKTVQENLEEDAPVYVYCASGGRSGDTMKKLRKIGFDEVYSLKGGITAWEESGREIVQSEMNN